MADNKAADRVAEIDESLAAIRICYKHVVSEIESRMKEKIVRLIDSNDEQLRGEIKAYQSLLTLPEQLQQERDQLTALPDEGAGSGALVQYD